MRRVCGTVRSVRSGYLRLGVLPDTIGKNTRERLPLIQKESKDETDETNVGPYGCDIGPSGKRSRLLG